MNKITMPAVILTLMLLSGCGQPVEVVPFTSQALSIHGIAPEGWKEVNPGHFSGDEWPIRQLIHEVYPGMTIEIVTATSILPRLGLDALTEPTGTHESGALAWDLYAIDVDDPDAGQIIVDLAMAETNVDAYVVALVTRVDDGDPLREEVFIPAVEAFEPIVYDQRDRVTVEELSASDYTGDGPVNYAYFLPMGESGSTLH